MKFIRRDYTAGISVAQDAAAIQDFMCSEIADMIVSTDTGWSYDERTPTKTSFISLPNGGGIQGYPQTRYPVLYLRNSTSGAKLAVVSILMNITSSTSSTNVNNHFVPVTMNIFQNQYNNAQAYHPCGIGIAMIPPGVETEFPDSYNSDTSFGNGVIRFMCEFSGTEASSTPSTGTYYNSCNGAMNTLRGSSGNIASYGLLVDDKTVFLFSTYATGTRGNLFLNFGLGKVIGTLPYDSESQIPLYGGLNFANMGGSDFNFDRTLYSSAGNVYYYGMSPYDTSAISSYYPQLYPAQSFAQDGTYRVCNFCILGTELLANAITNSESPDAIHWQPGIMYSSIGDPFYTGGDRFKGYLDTNLIRYAIANMGQLFNNGQFCCVATNLLLKWDPDATDTIMA